MPPEVSQVWQAQMHMQQSSRPLQLPLEHTHNHKYAQIHSCCSWLRFDKLFSSNPQVQMCSLEECELQRYGVGVARTATTAEKNTKPTTA